MQSMYRKQSHAMKHRKSVQLIHGSSSTDELPDEAFIQAMITATEAKTKALQVENVKDPLTGTIATGTSTDSLLIAATQQGENLPYAGPITPLGKLIAHGVYDCTVKAIQAYKKAKGWST